jgi:hypothetical protein
LARLFAVNLIEPTRQLVLISSATFTDLPETDSKTTRQPAQDKDDTTIKACRRQF